MRATCACTSAGRPSTTMPNRQRAPVIVFDVLYRLLRHLYGAEHVTYARNITDVDDKINARAREGGDLDPRADRAHHAAVPRGHRGARRLPPRSSRARPSTSADEGDDRGAGRARPRLCRRRPRAVRRAVMPDYGQLSGRTLDEMEAGARVEVAPYKRTRWTSCCGSRRRPASRHGLRRPASRRRAAGLAHRVLGDGGEAPRRRSSTSTAAASTSSSRTMRTRSRSRAAPTARR